MQARLNYLNSNTTKATDSSDKENEEETDKGTGEFTHVIGNEYMYFLNYC